MLYFQVTETEEGLMNLTHIDDDKLLVIHKVAKTRLRAFFRHPRLMMALRAEMERRGLK